MELMNRMREDKKRYRDQQERIQALPPDYRFVLEKMQGYMWSFAGGDGFDTLRTQEEVLALFEAGAAEGKHVLDVTGEDVAGFCDELMRGNRSWMDGRRRRLNRALRKIGTKAPRVQGE